MEISSRTPEGIPHRCPICGEVAALEPSYPGGDACCPACGHLVWWFRDRLGSALTSEGLSLEEALEHVTLQSPFSSLGIESLEQVELVMALEEEFGVNIPEKDAEQIQSVADAIRYLRKRRDDEAK